MTGAAVIGLLDPPAHISAGEVRLEGMRIDDLPLRGMQRIRGRRIGTAFQGPLTSLNPLLTFGQQLEETILQHLDVTRDKAAARALRGLDEVGIPSAKNRMGAYPHQFSGRQRQPICVARALASDPRLIACDEPRHRHWTSRCRRRC